jgi:hypothetical protein
MITFVDGASAAKKIRENLKVTQIPIIAMTAHVLPEHQELATTSGMEAVLTKPFLTEDLKTVLLRFVSS